MSSLKEVISQAISEIKSGKKFVECAADGDYSIRVQLSSHNNCLKPRVVVNVWHHPAPRQSRLLLKSEWQSLIV